MINDSLLDILGDYFVQQQMQDKGWTFMEFVEEYQRGYISF